MSYQEAAERAHSEHQRMVQAEAKLAAIEALITTPDEHGITRWRIGHARKRILAILDGGAA